MITHKKGLDSKQLKDSDTGIHYQRTIKGGGGSVKNLFYSDISTGIKELVPEVYFTS